MKDDNRTCCNDCGSVFNDNERVHRISYTNWDAEKQSFNKEPIEENYCRDCWSDIRPENKGAEFKIETTDGLWNILSSSNGKLVADFGRLIVGSHSIVRVNDELCELVYSKRRCVGEKIIDIKYKYEIKSKEWFDDFVSDIAESDIPSYVRIRNVDSTPFNQFQDIKSDQQLIDEFAE